MPAPALPRAALMVSGAMLASAVGGSYSANLLLLIAAALLGVGSVQVVGKASFAWIALGAGLLVLDLYSVKGGRLDQSLVGADVVARVRIADFPQQGRVLRLLVESVDTPALPSRLRLSWYDATERPALGECWLMTLRLRRPRGFSNPGRFDYEQWLLRKRVGATGYVRSGRRAPTCDAPGLIDRLRGRLLIRIRSALPDDQRTAVLKAITLGARQWIDDKQWNSFMRTGTGHLMAISGMHVALAAGSAYLPLRFLISLFGVQANHRYPAVIGSVGFAGVYAALSGFGVPSRRAILMLAVVAAASLLGKSWSPWQVLALACLAVAFGSPLDLISPGFMLSFAAVALLVHHAAVRSRLPEDSHGLTASLFRGASSLARLQLVLLCGLLPLTAGLFGRVSLAAPLANIIVLPLFSFLALPAALAGAAIPGAVGDILLLSAWHAIGRILDVLQCLSAIPAAEFAISRLGPYGLTACGVALVATLLPPGWPLRNIRWLAFTLLLARPGERPPDGCLDVDVLDVGQGLSTVLRTAGFTLVYDTGPAFRSGGDTGSLVLAPFLNYVGVRRVDLLVLSHDDLDHTGGLRSLDRFPAVSTVMRGEASRRGDGAATGIPCRAGQVWFRDSVRFAVLAPSGGTKTSGNNASCVLEASVGSSTLLMTGDIESTVERSLLQSDLLSPSDLVIVPHHGSMTSSHDRFVARLAPRIAVASAGFDNRWGMPRPEIVDRWRRAGADFFSTASDGAIGFRLCRDDELTIRYRQRHDGRSLWHEP